ncbi:MAG: 1-acyl-sn-glycerol-3-phosphate acyltransferase, partial [Cyclobacteriaceae bacterium]
MKTLLRRIYTGYVAFAFVSTFFLFLPVFLLGIYVPGCEKYGLLGNHWWAKTFFPMLFSSCRTEYRFKPDKKQNYVLCANHFSFFDI